MIPTTPTTPTTPAPFRTIAAKFAGICRRCDGPIAIGQTIRYGGKGRCYHLAADCPKGTGHTDDPPYAHLGNYADPDLAEPAPAAHRWPQLAPRAAGESAEAYGMRALLFVTAEGSALAVDTDGLQLAGHCYRLAVSNRALTPAGAERLADVGRLIAGALRMRAQLDAAEAPPAAPAPVQAPPAHRPDVGPMAALSPVVGPQRPPSAAQSAPPARRQPVPAPPVRLAPIAPLSAAELF